MTEESLFEQALNLPIYERAAFLDRECAGDAALRARIEALLAADAVGDSPLDHPVAVPEQTGQFTPQPIDGTLDSARTSDFQPESEGTVIAGRYKLRQQIGEGGMGTVWMADQTAPIKRKVAVKLIHVERGQCKTLLGRFEAERQAIALMDHPHIAKLLDAGSTATGAPFFVMELVRGIPLTDFCDQHKLGIPERLGLFQQICGAVQHAHQKGIIHRDLKPSNILVESHDGKAVPKVIDFGLAKAITGMQLTEQSLFTAFGSVMGTPLYMAPEQASFNAVDVDTRADVYALGVILYELLTGTTPIMLDTIKRAALDEMLKLIREQDPPKPSARLSSSESTPSVAANRQMEPAKLGRFVQGELDWIVLKALAKERERRYETPNSLAQDIGRLLIHEPVSAGPPSTSYRLRKFVRRNRLQVMAAGLVLFALGAGFTGMAIGLVSASRAARAERVAKEDANRQRAEAVKAADAERKARDREAAERSRAEKARDRTRDVLDAMTSSITGDSLATQMEISDEQKKFLTEVLAYYQEFAGEAADDEQTRVRTADAAFRVAMIESRLGRKERGITAIQMARDAYRKLAEEFPTVPGYRSQLAGTHSNLGILLKSLGNTEEAEQQYLVSMAIESKLVDDFPDVPDHRSAQASTHSLLGTLLHQLGRQEEAEEQYLQALFIQNELAAKFPSFPKFRNALSPFHYNLGSLLVETGRYEEAEEHFRKAVAISEKLAADFPSDADIQRDLANGRNNLGVTLVHLGKHAEADGHYRVALEVRKKLVAKFPAVPEYRRELSTSHFNLGTMLSHLVKSEEADEHFHQAIDIGAKLAADFPAVPDYRHELARVHQNLAVLLAEMGRQAEAEEEYRQAIGILGKLAADFPTVTDYRDLLSHSHNNLGTLLSSLGKPEESVEQFRQTTAILEKLVVECPTVPQYRRQLASTLSNLGTLLKNFGKHEEAEKHLRQSLEINKKLTADFPTVPEFRRALVFSHNNLAGFLVKLGNERGAEDQMRQTLVVLEQLCAEFPHEPSNRSMLAFCHVNLGRLFQSLGEWSEAEEQFREALTVETSLTVEFPAVPDYRNNLASTHISLGSLLREQGKSVEAEEQFNQALTIRKKLTEDFPNIPDYRIKLADNEHYIGSVHQDLDRPTEAEEHYLQGLAIQMKLAEGSPADPRLRQELARGYSNLVSLRIELKQWAEAEEPCRKALTLREELAAELPAMHKYNDRDALARSYNQLGIILKSLKKQAEAEAAYRKALTLRQKLAEAYPLIPRYQISLGGIYCNYGRLIFGDGRASESLGWFDKAIEKLDPIHRAELRDVLARRYLTNSLASRSDAYYRLQEYDMAMHDLNRAIEINAPESMPDLRAKRVRTQAHTEETDESTVEATELAKRYPENDEVLFHLAATYAILSGKIEGKKQEHADRAMKLLHSAVQAGYDDVDPIKNDPDLEPLREREDFKTLLEELENE